MKTSLKYIIACGFISLLNSCGPEYYPDGRIDKEDVFSTDKKTFSYLNLCYSHLQNQYKGMWYGNNSFLAAFTDDAYDANTVDNSASAQYWRGATTAYFNPVESGANVNWWGEYYQGINQCNTFIENIDEATVISDDDRQLWKAQAYVLRALYSLELAKRYGTIPYSTQSYPSDFNFAEAELKTFGEVALQIFEDCDYAINCEQLPWAPLAQDALRGMMTKGVAYAIKSQAALYAASPLFFDGNVTWTQAAEICGEAMDKLADNGYELFTKSGASNLNISAYDTYFNSRPDVSRASDRETILERRDQLSVWQWHGLPSTTGAMSAGNCPTQELVDCYETIDGKQPVLGYSDADHLRPIINPDATLYNEQAPYENRDPRLASTIYYHGAKKALNSASSFVMTNIDGGAESMDVTKQDKTHSPTGYYLRKYNNFASNLNSPSDGYFRIFRYAEILLNFAEAAAEAGNTVPEKAYQAVNAVRARVGMPPLEGLGKEEFIKRVRNERRVEFAYEENRFFDIRRWKAIDENQKVVTGMKVTTNSDGSYRFERMVVDNTRQCYTQKYLHFPIPGDEVIRLQTFTGVNCQNPGWE